MQSLAQRYSAITHRKYARTGSMWDGRFRAFAVESDAYVLACYRYIELNPVRAGMVRLPGGGTLNTLVNQTTHVIIDVNGYFTGTT